MANGLASQAKLLETIVEKLNEDSKFAPEVLVQPIAEKVSGMHQAVFGMIDSAMRSRDAPVSEEVQHTEGLIAEDLEQVRATLNKGPWSNPPVMRELRKRVNKVADKVTELQALRGTKQAFQPSAPRLAPSMAADNKVSSAFAKPMTVEEALGLLLEKTKCQWQGGLIGIVHAAGVQEMTPIAAHSPGRFEFIFAPKSQAAWNLHTYATMV
mmetsp:Transcript_28750/g.66978  ORF Transcript_28750/g.66978 Transcript_28750/m.66978 type:complete len:211 (+) Transcript_28750:66-698(+)|eukprot:CAMPEP_0171077758 /NCGR_PEP_ID=MMETSP0766_2-20121228/14237_1 /TAXON_ID=439317 /ORGANISM="Gambierdiscus australes, Strain CAWD 149" /LENGTH=210 /DNA_ID=CAMNT_0011534841 /DNA_START=46 /DNA_END=678 /DNA_ORIENTATION=+